MEKVKQQKLIVSVYPNGMKNKTIELQREVYDKFNIHKYPKLGFGTAMNSMEFQNFIWVMNGCMPKEIFPDLAKKIREGANGVVDAEVILFLNHNVMPLHEEAIDLMFEEALAGKIVNFSLYDGIAFSKETYQKLGEPNMKDLFTTARKQKVSIVTLMIKEVLQNGTKIYSMHDKELFLQTSEEQLYQEKCEEVLVRGMYEDRSIKY